MLILKGEMTPVFLVLQLTLVLNLFLDAFQSMHPLQPRETETRTVQPDEDKFSGFVLRQANMDPKHRESNLPLCVSVPGTFTAGMKLKQVRTQKDVKIPNALTFLAERGI